MRHGEVLHDLVERVAAEIMDDMALDVIVADVEGHNGDGLVVLGLVEVRAGLQEVPARNCCIARVVSSSRMAEHQAMKLGPVSFFASSS